MKRLAQALFEPKTVALIGASGDPKKNTSRPQRFLRKHGYAGEILPINPARPEVLGEKAYPDLDAVQGEIDHAYILLNGQQAVDALAACGKRGVKVASILAGGFADAGAAGASMQRELERIVRDLGDWCMRHGVARVTDDRSAAEKTQAGTMVGTPAYMSPEQITGGNIDTRILADIVLRNLLRDGRLPPHDKVHKAHLESPELKPRTSTSIALWRPSYSHKLEPVRHPLKLLTPPPKRVNSPKLRCFERLSSL